MQASFPRAGARARTVIEEFGVTAPSQIDLEAIAYAQGVLVRYAELAGAAARLVRRGRTGVIRVDTRLREEGQRRFAIAHELGHFLLHERTDQLAVCTAEALLFWYKQRPEEPEANAFAAELLMPAALFRPGCAASEPAFETIEKLASEFRTTLTATAFRYVELGSHICTLVASQRGTIQWFYRGPDFRFRLLPVGTRVDPRSGAGEFFAGKPIDRTAAEVLATCWIEDDRLAADSTLHELTVPLPSYESAVSLLWIKPGSPLDRFDDEDG